MKILVTGAAGFIGFHVVKQLVADGHEVTGIDNINDYYSTDLKYDRLKQLGIYKALMPSNKLLSSTRFQNLSFANVSLENKAEVTDIFKTGDFNIIMHLAAQAGVRYSLQNPDAYIKSNIEGFLHILEGCRTYPVKHLIYASSSSVYGMNQKVPFAPADNVDFPVSLYAATKKCNELMAYTYHHLFGIHVTGLRFFTVYGPWGRPDMAYFSFTKNILEEKEIQVFNNGNLMRDFTYIDDIVNGITRLMEKVISDPAKFSYNIYNLGNNKPVKLIDFIKILEDLLGKEAHKRFVDMQPGDVLTTYADITASERDFGYAPETNISEGLARFVSWYTSYYKQEVQSFTQ
ncbi:MAG: NAD-dependent epimerase/dehydratase family protein [Chitinophagaceae bacterium]